MKLFAKNNTNKTIEDILEYFYSKVKENYFPGILSEGNLFDEKNDLYIKIIAKKQDINLTETWAKENLSKDYSDGIFNLISSYNYKYNSIYGINPILLDDTYVTFVEQKDLDVLSMEYYNSEHRMARNKILYKENESIMFYFPVIKDYTELSKFSHEYDLYAEIEYRVLINGLKPNQMGVYTDNSGNIIDLIYEYNNNIKAAQKEKLKLYWLRATVKLDCKKLDNQVENDLNIKVVELGSNKIRPLNPNNYNDDIEAGLVVFSKESVNEIKKYYYFYDLNLIPRVNHISSCIVDYFDDIVVFWEGEFNSNIPIELKKALEKYNIKDKTSNIISTAMFNWQLRSKWEIFEDLLPNQQLARIVMRKKFDLAKDYGLDFYPPADINEYSLFAEKILAILNLKIKDLNLLPEKEKMLNDILEKKYIFESENDMINNFYGYCYLLVKVVGYEKE